MLKPFLWTMLFLLSFAVFATGLAVAQSENEQIELFAASADGRFVATVSYADRKSTVQLLDSSTFCAVRQFDVADRHFEVMALSHDATMLAYIVSGAPDYVGVIDIATGAILWEREGYNVSFFQLAWKPDENLLAYSYSGGTVLTDAENQTDHAYFLGGHDAIAWSASATQLANSSSNMATNSTIVAIWSYVPADAATINREPNTSFFGVGSSIIWVASDSGLVTEGAEGIFLYDIAAGTNELISRRNPLSLSASPDGSRFAAGAGDGIEVWDVSSRTVIQTISMPNRVSTIFWLPDGRILHDDGSAGLYVNGVPVEECQQSE